MSYPQEKPNTEAPEESENASLMALARPTSHNLSVVKTEFFRKCFSHRRNLKTPALRSSVWAENILKMKLLKNDDYAISLTELSFPHSNTDLKQLLSFQRFLRRKVMWTRNIRCAFRVKSHFKIPAPCGQGVNQKHVNIDTVCVQIKQKTYKPKQITRASTSINVRLHNWNHGN